MGWGFRKSVKFGPVRLNFSKSGIGVSAGVKGARVSTGPRGTYLNLGRGPFYYRQKLGGSSRTRSGPVEMPRPEVVANVLPRNSDYLRPRFPEHGFPRIVTTLTLLLLPVFIVGLWALVYLSATSRPTRPVNSPAAAATVTPSPSPSATQVRSKAKKGGKR